MLSLTSAQTRVRERLPAVAALPRYDALRLALVAVAVSVVTWPVSTLDPGFPSESWPVGLHLAASAGLRFGHDIVFTYGPYGYLTFPLLVTGRTAVAAFAFAIVLHTIVAGAALRTLRTAFAWPAAIAGALVVSALPLPLADALVVLALICFVHVLREPSPRTARLVAPVGGALAAFVLLVKINDGVICVVLAALASWFASAARVRGAATFVASLAASFVALWLLAGMRLGDLPDWFRLSAHTVASYAQAMELPTNATDLRLALVLFAVTLLIAGAEATTIGGGRGGALVLGVIVFEYAYLKEGFIRSDSSHSLVCFAAMAACGILIARTTLSIRLCGLAIALIALQHVDADTSAAVNLLLVAAAAEYAARGRLPGATTRILVAIVPVVLLGLLVGGRLQLRDLLPGGSRDTSRLIGQAHTLVSPSRRHAAIARFRAEQRANLPLPSSVVRAAARGTVDVQTDGAWTVWAYGFRWSPQPFIENYSAYDSVLDRTAADAITSRGPDRLIQSWGAIDRQSERWHGPALVLAELCSYRRAQTVAGLGGYDLLVRSTNRCEATRSLGSVSLPAGRWARVPPAHRDELVYATVELPRPSLGARLWAALYKPPILTAATRPGTDDIRFVAGTAQDPHILSVPSLPELATPRLPNVRALQIRVPSGDVRIRFYAVRLRA